MYASEEQQGTAMPDRGNSCTMRFTCGAHRIASHSKPVPPRCPVSTVDCRVSTVDCRARTLCPTFVRSICLDPSRAHENVLRE
eukprot:7363217-Prymnesium_polylepis.2